MNQIDKGNLRFMYGGDKYTEYICLKADGMYKKILQLVPYATIVGDQRRFNVYYRECSLVKDEHPSDSEAVVYLRHNEYDLIRKITIDPDNDAVHFDVTLITRIDKKLRSVEDRWNFLFPRHQRVNEMQGPLDFVWSQKIKIVPQNFIPDYSFRTPMIVFQQKQYCAVMAAGLENVTAADLETKPLGLDLDVTGEKWPWMSFGVVTNMKLMPNAPCEAMHSQIVRGCDPEWQTIDAPVGTAIHFHYSLLLFEAEKNKGYRNALRYIWNRYYSYKLLSDKGVIQTNPRFPKARRIEDWEEAIFEKSLRDDYFEIVEKDKIIGAVAGKRQGDWYSRTNYNHDAWFACWLQELATGYGMYLYGEKKNNDMKDKAEEILNFILSAPRNKGMFPIICYVESDGSKTWLNDDGWAGYYEEYHSLMMSWTGFLMLLWGKHLFKEREKDIFDFLIPYGDFLCSVQRQNGCIPSWFNKNGKPEREQFRKFNAETSISAAFLLGLGKDVNSDKYVNAGIKAIGFINEYVRPRNRWFDMETFRSCQKKDFSFYDGITAQYPQCNLSQIYAAIAYYVRDEIAGNEQSRKEMEEIMDYLLLSQQVWSHPLIKVDVFGGFNVQNADNEWSDVREAICAVLLHRYYLKTGRFEYLCRGVYAMLSGFQVLPYENWAHCGYEGMQYDSSLLWGGGIVLTAGEYYDKYVGDLAVDCNECKAVSTVGAYVNSVSINDGKLYINVGKDKAGRTHPDTITIYYAPKALEVIINENSYGSFDKDALKAKIHLTKQ